jgi:BirA family biotin operon repressor/biotin-[acetyl-CoA-carboxylase] ligase
MPMSADSHQDTLRFSPDDGRRLLATTSLQTVEVHGEVASTNDRAVELAARADLATPALVLAEQQTAGRGRGRNRWWTGPGALTFSLVLDLRHLALPPAQWPKLSLTVGLAVCEALRELLDPRRPALKWPNDVLVDGRKLCGILVEIPSSQTGRVVVGVGLNVNNSVADAPADVQRRATSLFDETGRPHDRFEVLTRLLARLDDELGLLVSDSDLPARWQPWCWLSGRTVCVENEGLPVHGFCRGIDADGALLLQTSTGLERVYSGVVLEIGSE